MKMIIFFILIALLVVQESIHLFKFVAEVSAPFQNFCENLSLNVLNYRDVQKTLLCGSPLLSAELSLHLRQQSLIHLFIVSGGHFILLEKLLQKMKIPQVFHVPALTCYNFLTGFQAPGTRSLTQMLLSRLTKKTVLELREDQRLLFCGFFLLLVFPIYGKSASFLLSWTAALALNICSVLFFKQKGFHKLFYSQLLISIILLPWLWAFGNGHPLGILSNIIFGPFIVFVLFPLSALVIVFPVLAWLFDYLTWTFEWILQQTSSVFPESVSQGISLEFFWLYLFGLHLLLHWYQVNRWQNSS